MIHNGLSALEVDCLPEDLPKRIVIDISGLAELGDSLRVHDVVLSEEVKILADPEEILAIATVPKKEEINGEVPVAEEAAPKEIEPDKKD